jgi:hypothetical protein
MAADPRRGRHSAPSPARGIAATLVPWRRRILTLVVTWVVLVALAIALGLVPQVPILLAATVAAFVLGWHAIDHVAAQHVTVWPLVDGELGLGGRGNDFRVANLAGRLEAANVRAEGRESLVHDLHVQLQVIIRERLYSKHGLVAEEEPRWSEGVTPPELWQLLVALPPADLYRPDRLDPILRRIEQW